MASGNTQFKIEQGLLVVSDGANSDFYTNVNVQGAMSVNGVVSPNSIVIGAASLNSTQIAVSTGAFTSSVNVGSTAANVQVVNSPTSKIIINVAGANAVVNATAVTLANSTATASLNVSTLSLGGSTVNTTSVNTSIVTSATSVAVGANVNLSTTQISIGNSTVNVVANSSVISTGDLLVSGNANIGTSATIGNSSTNTFSNSTIVVVANTSRSANITSSGLVVGSTLVNGSIVQTVSANITTLVAVGSNTFINTSTFFNGNSTVNNTSNSTLLQITDTINNANLSSSQLKIGTSSVNSTVVVAPAVTSNTITVAGGKGNVVIIGGSVILAPSLSIGNGTVNTSISPSNVITNSITVFESIQSGNVSTNTTAITIIDNSGLTTVNSTFYSATANQALTANNATNLGGSSAGAYALLAANNSFTGNNTFGGTNTVISSNVSLTGILNANNGNFVTVTTGNTLVNNTAFFVGNSTTNAFMNSTFVQIQTSLSLMNLRATGVALGNTTLGRSSIITDSGTFNVGVGIGANIAANTSTLLFGNSTVNNTINSLSVTIIGQSGSQAVINSTAYSVGDTFFASIINSTAISAHTATLDSILLGSSAGVTANNSGLFLFGGSGGGANLTITRVGSGLGSQTLIVGNTLVNAATIIADSGTVGNLTSTGNLYISGTAYGNGNVTFTSTANVVFGGPTSVQNGNKYSTFLDAGVGGGGIGVGGRANGQFVYVNDTSGIAAPSGTTSNALPSLVRVDFARDFTHYTNVQTLGITNSDRGLYIAGAPFNNSSDGNVVIQAVGVHTSLSRNTTTDFSPNTFSTLTGGYVTVGHGAAVNTSAITGNAYGTYYDLTVGAATINNLYGVRVGPTIGTNSTVIANVGTYYGLYLAAANVISGSSITTPYHLYQADTVGYNILTANTTIGSGTFGDVLLRVNGTAVVTGLSTFSSNATFGTSSVGVIINPIGIVTINSGGPAGKLVVGNSTVNSTLTSSLLTVPSVLSATSLTTGNSTVNTAILPTSIITASANLGNFYANTTQFGIGANVFANNTTVKVGPTTSLNVTTLSVQGSTLNSTILAVGGISIGGGTANLVNFNETPVQGAYSNVQILTANTYNVLKSDSGTILDIANTTVCNISLKATTDVGFNVTFIQSGTGILNFNASAAAVIHQRRGFTNSAGQWAVVRANVRANANGSAAEWVLDGDMA